MSKRLLIAVFSRAGRVRFPSGDGERLGVQHQEQFYRGV